jgi:hypothetical protein
MSAVCRFVILAKAFLVVFFIGTLAMFQLTSGCQHYFLQGCKTRPICLALMAFSTDGCFTCQSCWSRHRTFVFTCTVISERLVSDFVDQNWYPVDILLLNIELQQRNNQYLLFYLAFGLADTSGAHTHVLLITLLELYHWVNFHAPIVICILIQRVRPNLEQWSL